MNDFKLLAELLNKKLRDTNIEDIQFLIGKSGSLSPLRHGMPRIKCTIKSIEISTDIKLIVLIGKHKVKRHISKFSFEHDIKKPEIAEQRKEFIKCTCDRYFKRHGVHSRSCPIHILGYDKRIDGMKDIIDLDDSDDALKFEDES